MVSISTSPWSSLRLHSGGGLDFSPLGIFKGLHRVANILLLLPWCSRPEQRAARYGRSFR
jgi:hypothetical protein